MKNLLTKYFGLLGLVVYYSLAFVLRIPVALLLVVFIVVFLLIWAPISGNDNTPKWLNNLYDWYCGK